MPAIHPLGRSPVPPGLQLRVSIRGQEEFLQNYRGMSVTRGLPLDQASADWKVGNIDGLACPRSRNWRGRDHGCSAVRADLEQRPRTDDGTGSGVCPRRKHRISRNREDREESPSAHSLRGSPISLCGSHSKEGRLHLANGSSLPTGDPVAKEGIMQTDE